MHIARFQAPDRLINEWSSEYARLMTWGAPILYSCVAIPLYRHYVVPTGRFLLKRASWSCLAATHPFVVQRHNPAYRTCHRFQNVTRRQLRKAVIGQWG